MKVVESPCCLSSQCHFRRSATSYSCLNYLHSRIINEKVQYSQLVQGPLSDAFPYKTVSSVVNCLLVLLKPKIFTTVSQSLAISSRSFYQRRPISLQKHTVKTAIMFVLALFSSAVALAIPTAPLTALSEIVPTNENTTVSMLATALRFNIDPDIKGIACGKQFPVNINVKDAGTASSTSSTCNAIRDLLVGSDNKGNSNVNLFFTCPGQTLSTGGVGDRDIKITLNTVEVPVFDEIDTTTPGTMTVISDKNKFAATTSVDVGITKSSNTELIWQYITCH